MIITRAERSTRVRARGECARVCTWVYAETPKNRVGDIMRISKIQIETAACIYAYTCTEKKKKIWTRKDACAHHCEGARSLRYSCAIITYTSLLCVSFIRGVHLNRMVFLELRVMKKHERFGNVIKINFAMREKRIPEISSRLSSLIFDQ